MGKYTQIIIKLFCAASILLLSGCAIQGAYFSPSAAASSIRVDHKTYHPTLVPLTAQLYADSMAPATATPAMRGLWYANNYGYQIGPTDVLAITVWDHPELSTPMRLTMQSTLKPNNLNAYSSDNIIPGILVDAHGDIYYPYAGIVHAAGLTVNQLREVLVNKLKHMIRDPQINVRVVDFRSRTIQVLGAVNQQGSVSITDTPLTIFDAIADRGGINVAQADTRHIFVIRGSGLRPTVFILNADSPSNLLVAQHFKLRKDDIIFVPQSNLANWNRFVSQVLPTVEAVAYTKTLTR